MAVAIASGLGKNVAGNPLLRGVSFRVERGQRLALSGRNGSGKTTLLRMLAGETPIDAGGLSLEKGVRVALHDQRPPRERDLTLRQYVLSGCADLIELEERLARLEQVMASGDSDQATFDGYAAAQARLEHAGGYDWRRRATAVVRGLGFADADLDRPLHTFSGGELTRGSLARTLAGDPDLMLLDEPTNHLDVTSLEWLEERLTTTDAAIVLVAHDRWFLEAVGTAVLELEAGRSRFFAGPWHAWRKERAARELALGRAIERQRAEIERMERFVTRFRAGTRSRQAQARVKKLARMARLERDPRAGRAPGFKFEQATRSGRVALELEGATIAAGERRLLDGAELWLERGEHVTLVGPNGAGKTTLIETLAGRRPLTDGKLRRGHNAELAFLSQHAEEIDGEGTALEAAQRATGLTPNRARALLGRFLFSGADAEKEVAVLSGGELRRLSLAILVASGANVLVLDEPTNHLDLESREALEDSLRAYDGALLLVSHDRALLDAVGTRTIALEDGRLCSYEGGWADYLRVREERRAAEGLAHPARSGRRTGRRREGQAARPAVSKNAKRRIAALERAVAEAEAALAGVEDALADPVCWSTPEREAESTERHREAKQAVERLYEELAALEVS
ncbi:MAG: ABC-F family ATP-binding cassette domain-containing protein [Solirubrobacterales bacterium]